MSEYIEFSVDIPAVETEISKDLGDFVSELWSEETDKGLASKVGGKVEEMLPDLVNEHVNNWWSDQFSNAISEDDFDTHFMNQTRIEAKAFADVFTGTPVHNGDLRRDKLCDTGRAVYDMIALVIDDYVTGNENLACKCTLVTDPKEVPAGISNRLQAIEKFMRRQSNDMYDTFTRLQSPAQQAELHDEEPF